MDEEQIKKELRDPTKHRVKKVRKDMRGTGAATQGKKFTHFPDHMKGKRK